MDQNKAYVMDYHFQTDLFSTYFALYPKQKCKMSQFVNERQRQTILYYWEKGLNPIENLWNIVKTNVERRKPKNCKDLEQFMTEEWDNIPNTVLINLIDLMKQSM